MKPFLLIEVRRVFIDRIVAKEMDGNLKNHTFMDKTRVRQSIRKPVMENLAKIEL